MNKDYSPLIPAKAGIQPFSPSGKPPLGVRSAWIPAFAGMSGLASAVLLAAPAFAQKAGDRMLTMIGARAEREAALPDPLEAGWKGEKICEVLQETEKFRALKCTFAPGRGHERHYHAPHFGYILEGGRMRVTDKNGTREIETPAGASWKSDGVDWHEAVNIGDATAIYIIVEPKEAE